MMTQRSDIQQAIADHIAAMNFDAPYGILCGQNGTVRGSPRTVTFGRARTLDATVTIWGAEFIAVRTSRGRDTDQVFRGVAALADTLRHIDLL